MLRLGNAFCLLLIAIWVLPGCSVASLEDRIIGQWKGKVELTSDPSRGGTFRIGADSFEPTINFKPDKTFDMTVAVIPVKGTWALQGSKITLNILEISGQSKADFKKRAERELAGNPFIPQVDFSKADQPVVLDIGPEVKTLGTSDISRNLSFLGPLAPSGRVVFKRLGAPD